MLSLRQVQAKIDKAARLDSDAAFGIHAHVQLADGSFAAVRDVYRLAHPKLGDIVVVDTRETV